MSTPSLAKRFWFATVAVLLFMAADTRADFFVSFGCGHPGGVVRPSGATGTGGEFFLTPQSSFAWTGESFFGPVGFRSGGESLLRQAVTDEFTRQRNQEAAFNSAVEAQVAGRVGGGAKAGGGTPAPSAPSLADLGNRLTALEKSVDALSGKVESLTLRVNQLWELENRRQQDLQNAQFMNAINQAVQQSIQQAIANQNRLLFDAISPLAQEKPDWKAATEALKKLQQPKGP